MRVDWHWGQLGTGESPWRCDVKDGRRKERRAKEKAPGGEHTGLVGNTDRSGATETA